MENLVYFVLILIICVFLHVVYNLENCDRIDNCCREWDKISGECKVCSPGYLGQNCTQACPYPNYGLECQGKCECDDRLCDIATGCFSVTEGCRTGYYGDRCMHRCRMPTYGKHCQHICHCEESNCHYITGCPVKEATTIFILETTTFSSISMKEVKGVPMLVLILSITLASVVTISLIVIIAICRRMKSTKDKCPATDHPKEAREYIDTKDVVLSGQQYSSPCRNSTKPVQISSMELRKSSDSAMCDPYSNYYESVEFFSLEDNAEYSEIREPNDQDTISDVKTEDNTSYVEMNTKNLAT